MKGFKEADADSFAVADDQKKFMEKTKGKGYTLLKKMPGYDVKEKKLKKEISATDKCAPVYLQCKGTQGEVSNQALPIEQGRLLGPKIKTLTCSTTANDLQSFIRGDPGSVFTFICPENCMAGGSLVGTGLYAYKSSICKAAIQQNVLSNSASG